MSNQTDFIRSVTVGLIFVPYHFICDVARKIVFLRREKIEAWLLGSVCCSCAIALITFVYYFFINKIYLFEGQFPLVVPILTTALLFLIYAVFKGSVFKLYDDLQDFVFFDSILADVKEKEKVIQLTDDDELSEMQEITAEPEITEEPEITAEPAITAEPEIVPKVKKSNFNKMHAASQTNQANITKQESPEDQAFAALQAALNDQMAAKQSIAGQHDLEQSSAMTVSTLNKEAKKALYKNKMLSAIKGRLENIKSERELSQDELNQVCKTQEFISSNDFTSISLNMDIDEMLFGE